MDWGAFLTGFNQTGGLQGARGIGQGVADRWFPKQAEQRQQQELFTNPEITQAFEMAKNNPGMQKSFMEIYGNRFNTPEGVDLFAPSENERLDNEIKTQTLTDMEFQNQFNKKTADIKFELMSLGLNDKMADVTSKKLSNKFLEDTYDIRKNLQENQLDESNLNLYMQELTAPLELELMQAGLDQKQAQNIALDYQNELMSATMGDQIEKSGLDNDMIEFNLQRGQQDYDFNEQMNPVKLDTAQNQLEQAQFALETEKKLAPFKQRLTELGVDKAEADLIMQDLQNQLMTDTYDNQVAKSDLGVDLLGEDLTSKQLANEEARYRFNEYKDTADFREWERNSLKEMFALDKENKNLNIDLKNEDLKIKKFENEHADELYKWKLKNIEQDYKQGEIGIEEATKRLELANKEMEKTDTFLKTYEDQLKADLKGKELQNEVAQYKVEEMKNLLANTGAGVNEETNEEYLVDYYSNNLKDFAIALNQGTLTQDLVNKVNEVVGGDFFQIPKDADTIPDSILYDIYKSKYWKQNRLTGTYSPPKEGAEKSFPEFRQEFADTLNEYENTPIDENSPVGKLQTQNEEQMKSDPQYQALENLNIPDIQELTEEETAFGREQILNKIPENYLPVSEHKKELFDIYTEANGEERATRIMEILLSLENGVNDVAEEEPTIEIEEEIDEPSLEIETPDTTVEDLQEDYSDGFGINDLLNRLKKYIK